MRILPANLLATLLLASAASFAFSQGEQKPASEAQGAAQESKPEQARQTDSPQVKYNYLNVCNPSEAEKKEFAAALDRIPVKPAFTKEFEVTRGRTVVSKDQSAHYVRLRRDLTDPAFTAAQYSLSTDEDKNVEVLVLKLKDPKDLFTVSLEDQLSAMATKAASALDADTPVSRIKLERFGRSNLVLARCDSADQGAYEPLFKQASGIMANYRRALGLRTTFRSDLAWLTSSAAQESRKKSKPMAAKSAPQDSPSPEKSDKPNADKPK